MRPRAGHQYHVSGADPNQNHPAITEAAASAEPNSLPSFANVSVRLSQTPIGHEGSFDADPAQLTARNVTLKTRLRGLAGPL